MSAHSPGPWHPNVNVAGDLEVNAADGRTVVKWYASEDCLAPGDPSLIAAAPELLAALKEACKTLPLADWHDIIDRIEGGE